MLFDEHDQSLHSLKQGRLLGVSATKDQGAAVTALLAGEEDRELVVLQKLELIDGWDYM